MSKRISRKKPAKVIDYQAVLRDIAKSMVRLRRPERLLRMVVKYIHREIGLMHASIVVFQEGRKHYTFVDSKGQKRIPVGLVKLDSEHPLVRWFQRDRSTRFSATDYLTRAQIDRWMANGSLSQGSLQELKLVLKAMNTLKVDLVIPGYYKRTLLGLLLLGGKVGGDPFTDPEIAFFQILTQDCSMAVKTAEYHQSLIERNRELSKELEENKKLRRKEQETYYQIMRSLAQEVYAKDAYTFGHVGQVERLGLMAAREMGLDLTGRKKDILSAGLILHDVGKIGIPDHILNKPSALNEEEWKIMRTHVDKGVMILEPLTDFKEVKEIVRCHHENHDGSGYPRGLKGGQIPVESRIVAVVDAFHAIVSTRCYSRGRPVETAFEELGRCAGTQFDPKVVEAFIRGMKKELKKRGIDFYVRPYTRDQVSSEDRIAS